MFKRITAVFAALVVSGVLFVAGAGGASAQSNNGVCEPTEFCAWYYSDFTGPMIDHAGNVDPWPSRIQDLDWSWWNRGTPCNGCDHVRLFDAEAGGARTLCIHYGHAGNLLTNSATLAAADRTDAHRWGGECGANEPQL